MLTACAVTKTVMGVVLGLLWRIEPALQGIGLSPWQGYAGELAGAYPFNGGTGFFVSRDGQFVSAHHVIGTCRYPAVLTPDGVFVGHVLVTSAADDVTLIQTAYQPDEEASFPAITSYTWQPVTIARMVQCGGLASRALAHGYAAPIRGAAADRILIRVEEPILGGNSGSPVIDETGALAGMLVARTQSETRIGIAVRAERIADLMRSVGVEPRAAPFGVPLSANYYGLRTAAYTFPVVCLQ